MDDLTFMTVGVTENLQFATQRFNDSAERVVSAARELSGSSQGGGDIAGALVDMAVNQRVVDGSIAAVRASNDLTGSILDIVA
jgi:hypothetical protein